MEMKIDAKDVVTIIQLCEMAFQVEAMEVKDGPVGYWYRIRERLTEGFEYYFKENSIGMEYIHHLAVVIENLIKADDMAVFCSLGTVDKCIKEYLREH